LFTSLLKQVDNDFSEKKRGRQVESVSAGNLSRMMRDKPWVRHFCSELQGAAVQGAEFHLAFA